MISKMNLKTTFLEERDPWIIAMCKGKKVLHLGCTDWPLTEQRIKTNRLLHKLLVESSECVVGIDTDSQGIEALRHHMPAQEFYVASCEALDQTETLLQPWDIILAADVLEHVSNVGMTLSAASRLMSPETRLLITLPSAFSAKRFALAAFLGMEHVHPDHCYYFSPSTMLQCLARAGLIAESFSMFMWHNPHWRNRLAAALLRPFNLLTGGRLADELAIVAKLAATERNINRMD